MNSEHQPPRSSREIELAVEGEGREWTRQRLQQELQKEADLMAAFSPTAEGAWCIVYVVA